MANRTTKVTLVAQVAGYVEGMERAAAATRKTGTEAERLAQQKEAFNLLGGAAVAFGAVAAAGLAIAIKKFADFDQAMSNVNAVTQETAENQQRLRDSALEAGAASVFTATEAANAQEELAKAGLSTDNILSSLNGTLDLAASGQLGVARAAEITGIALKQFGLDGSQAGRVADVLSAGANKAVGSVEDLANGLKFVGPVAKGMNISLEDTTATLALFADRGVIGEQAGTSLRGMLASLTSPSKAAQRELENLGVTLYDGQGKFKGLENVAGELSRVLRDTDDATRDMALGTIFGNQQITAARILVDAGAETWRDYREAVDDSGIAARIAAQRLDNLAGDVEKLGGAFDTALIKTGSNANDALRFMTQLATDVVDSYSDLPGPMQAAAFWIGAVGAASLLAGGTMFLAIPKIVAFRTAVATMSTGVQVATRSLGYLAGAVALGVTMTVYAEAVQKLARQLANIDEITTDLVSSNATLAESMRELHPDIPTEWYEDWGGTLDALAAHQENIWARVSVLWDKNMNAGIALGGTLKELGVVLGTQASSNLPAAQKQFRAYTEELDANEEQIWTMIQAMPEYRDALIAQIQASGEVADKTAIMEAAMGPLPGAFNDAARTGSKAADAYLDAADEAAGLQGTLNELIDTIMEANGIGQDAVSANIDYQAALQGVRDQITEISKGTEGYSRTLDIATAAGRDNYDTLLSAADAGQKAAAAQYALDGNTQAYVAALQANRDTILQNAIDLGATDEQVQFLSDHIVAMPSQKEIEILAVTEPARRAFEQLINDYSGRTITMSAALRAGASRADLLINERGGMYESGVKAFQTGGHASGIYSDRQGPLYKFAEPGVGFETFISGKPGYERQNIGYALESLDRLGFQFPQAAPPQPPLDPRSFGTPDAPVRLDADSIERLGEVMARKLAGYSRTDVRMGVA